jgi:hypothetical protein
MGGKAILLTRVVIELSLAVGCCSGPGLEKRSASSCRSGGRLAHG